ncbi:MAG: NADH-quinone oxidoreductase subunit L, partial [Proteobacteria bacterium]|nr:NADH-quinone oxidoreductase subunit L [Pseudomonadota bacterium]
MTFHGTPRADDRVMAHVHESPKVMIVPLIVLATGAVLAGLLAHQTFVGEHAADFWGAAIVVLPTHPALENAHHVPVWVKYLPLVVGIGGISTAYLFYIKRTDLPGKLAGKMQGLYQFLLNKWYFDEVYDTIFVKPAFKLGRILWKGGDGMLIDGFGPDGISNVVRVLSRRVAALQTGYLYHYAFAMLIGIAGLVSWYIFMKGV